MSDDQYGVGRSPFLEWLKLLVAAGATVAALATYVYQQEATRTQQRSEYQRRLWEQQLDLYMQAVKAASTLAGSPDPGGADYKAARARFEQLFLGELCVVESPEVEHELVRFHNALAAYDDAPDEKKRSKLLELCRFLALACRKSTEEAWRVNLGELKS